jgi:hypothetical protein
VFKLTGWNLDVEKVKWATLSTETSSDENVLSLDRFRSWLYTMLKSSNVSEKGGILFALSDMKPLLEKLGFKVAENADFIEAIHVYSGKRILVAIEPSAERFGYYASKRGRIVKPPEFKFIMTKLAKFWRHKEDERRGLEELYRELLTSLDWHANLSEASRRKALEDAVVLYGYQYVSKALLYLSNLWLGTRGSMKNVEIVKGDRRWLRREQDKYDDPLETEKFFSVVRQLSGGQWRDVEYERCFVLTL